MNYLTLFAAFGVFPVVMIGLLLFIAYNVDRIESWLDPLATYIDRLLFGERR